MTKAGMPKLTEEQRAELKARRTKNVVENRKEARLEKETSLKEAFIAMNKEKVPITIQGLAKRAGVSRGRVYKAEVVLLKEIQEACKRTAVKERSTMQAQSSEASLMKRLSDAIEDVRLVRKENARLKAENERLTRDLIAVVGQVRNQR